MSDYEQVKKSMQAGTPPELICATCPWDRLCITPPTMTAAEVEQQLAQAKNEDAARKDQAGGGKGFPVATLMMAMVVAGKDTAAQLCPVFALRLRGPEGRAIADSVRTQMQRFGEPDGGSR
jgi:hypothetical protein